MGTVPEVVSRRLVGFARAGLVRTEGGAVTPLDAARLTRIKDVAAFP